MTMSLTRLEAKDRGSQVNRLLLGLSLLFSYNHLLFNPTVALPVDGVGVPGVALLELSPNKLLLIGLP